MNKWSEKARRTSFGRAGAGLAVMVLLAAMPANAQETAVYFQQNCASCHTIGGGRLTGPDLKDVTGRRDREWLKSYILNPQAKMDAGDPYALQLLDEARGVVMPIPPGITPERADYLLDLIEAESALEESQFKGVQISNEPFTAADVARGLAIFKGSRKLKNGGPACYSCHSVSGLGGLGGGNLDPERGDLTLVYERLQGRTVLSSWLMAPATPTMNSVFKAAAMESDEIHALVALFEDRAQAGKPAKSQAQLTFALLGAGGAALALMFFDFVWKGRFLAVRRPLVESEKL
ncbi:MAG: cytochrome c [Candidatus Hydrogenedentes bacterium]|nr:cytochrome c [Candidatus Hydrogenedentota bacterium]MDK1020016.1 cytochrome c [Candidatus Hydrogenedentota bacterium]